MSWGTQELIKMLNRVGAVASIDTSQQLATNIVHARLAKGVLSELDRNVLTHDLLGFRAISQAGYEDYIQTKLLNSPSKVVGVRRKRLNTFSTTQAEKRIKQVEKETKMSQIFEKKV